MAKNTPTYNINETQAFVKEAAANRLDRAKQLSQEGRGSTNIQSEREITKEINAQVAALKEAKKYQDALLSGKKDILKAQVESLNKAIEEQKLTAIAVKDINARQKLLDSIAEKERERDDKLERALKMEAELNRAYYENVSITEKKAALQERLNKAKREEKKLQDEMVEAIAEARTNNADESVIKAIRAEYNSKIRAMYSDFGLKEGGGLKLKDAFSSGLSEALSSGSVVQGVGTMLSSALGPVTSILTTIAKFTSSINKTLDKGIEAALSTQNDYLGKVNSRLQGSSESYQNIVDYLRRDIGATPFLSQKKVLENIAQLVESGTAVNLEERGILMSLSDRMVSTFEVLNPTLKRLVRIQQTDMTASQLGYEAQLTNFFNKQFEDTSYLSDMYDSIMSTLVDATSQLDVKSAGEFNFEVQKWLGSLYSMGVSESGVSNIAQGLSYLATGNVDALNSNDSLRNLFAAASGSAYSSILTGGLNGATVNSLMYSIVEYLRSIASDSNNVTKAARAGIFGGFSMSDIRAIANLSDANLSSIYGYNSSYADAMAELGRQFNYATNTYGTTGGVGDRTSLAGLIDTYTDNLLYQFGNKFMDNEEVYLRWRLKSMVAQSGVPVISQLADISKFADYVGGALDNWAGNPAYSMWDGGFSGTAPSSSSDDAFQNLVNSILGIRLSNLKDNGELSTTLTGIATRAEAVSRGNADNYASIAAQNTFTGLSVSERLGAAGSIIGLADTAAATAMKTQVEGATTSGNVADLYSELFEKQTTAIKVSLSTIDSQALNSLGNIILNNSKGSVGINGISESVLKALAEYMHVEKLDSLENRVVNEAVDVNTNENFVNSINSGLNYMRGL